LGSFWILKAWRITDSWYIHTCYTTLCAQHCWHVDWKSVESLTCRKRYQILMLHHWKCTRCIPGTGTAARNGSICKLTSCW
jgi:hypothetical protein